MIDFFVSQYLNLQAYMNTGGIIMAPLAAVSLVMWVLIVERSLFFRRLHHKKMGLTTAADHIVANKMPDPARYRGAISLLVARFLQHRSHDRQLDRYILDETVLSINRCLNDYLAVIGVLAALAPLLGLLGTVTGMIATFDILTIFGTGNPRAMAGGISEALITTQTGLLVAIPGLYMKSFLDRRARILKQHITRVGYHLKRQL